VISELLLLLAVQANPEELARRLSVAEIEARSRAIDAVVGDGMKMLRALQAIESGDFNADAKAGAQAARREIVRRHRIAACKGLRGVKVSIPPGEYSIEDAAERALGPFGVSPIVIDTAMAGRRFHFALET
jgi:hypothetical protein